MTCYYLMTKEDLVIQTYSLLLPVMTDVFGAFNVPWLVGRVRPTLSTPGPALWCRPAARRPVEQLFTVVAPALLPTLALYTQPVQQWHRQPCLRGGQSSGQAHIYTVDLSQSHWFMANRCVSLDHNWSKFLAVFWINRYLSLSNSSKFDCQTQR